MATHRIPIAGWNTLPDATGDAFFEPYSILATNDIFKHLILRLGANNAAQPTVKSGIYGVFSVPKNYVGTASIVIVWTATLTSGDVVFDFDYRSVAGNDAASLDQATFEESVTVTNTAPTAAHSRLEASVNLTSANLAADETIEFFFGRDGVAAADTMAGSAMIHGVYLQYSDV